MSYFVENPFLCHFLFGSACCLHVSQQYVGLPDWLWWTAWRGKCSGVVDGVVGLVMFRSSRWGLGLAEGRRG